MAIQLQLRKGNTLAHSTFTGAAAEVTVDTSKKTVVVHDGSTAGGFPLALKTDVANLNSNISVLTTANIAESGNLYFTNARVVAALTAGQSITIDANGRINSTVTADVVSVNGLTGTVTLTTANIAESGNLYFTNTRAINAFTEGTGINIDSNGLISSTVTGDVASVNGLTGTVTLTTANIAESGNLYFTNTRAINAFTEGTGINIDSNGLISSTVTGDVVSVNGLTGTVTLTTANIAESSNLYFTDARVYSNVVSIGYATVSHVSNEIANLVNSAPATLDTLNELANALGNDASFSTSIINSLATKANTASLTTANVTELTNLYFTNTRAINAFTEGTGINIDSNGLISSTVTGDVVSVNGLTGTVTLTTANIAESGNLYFTNARSIAALSAGQNITIDANGRINSTVTGGGGGSSEYSVKTGNYTAVSGDLIVANTSGGAFTITLPATPSAGNNVKISDGSDFAAYNLTVARNGSTIEGAAEDFVLNVTGVGVEFVYTGSTWQVYVQFGDDSVAAATTVANSNIVGNIISSQIQPTGVTASTYGNATIIPVITIDQQGRITSASNATVVSGVSTGKSIAMAMIFGF